MIIFISFILIIFSLFYFYRRQRLTFFSKVGISGPAPNFIFGNLIEYRKTPFYDLLLKWSEDYGKVFGYFEGPTPNLVIGDPDLLQEVFVKQFSNFHGRKLFPMQKNPDKDEKVSMFLARGKRWKRLRTTINPAFSDSKMRRMFPLIDDSISSLISKIEEQVSKGPVKMEIQEILQRLTMDIICKCAFGIDTNCQTNVNHPFIVCLKQFLGGANFSTLKAAFILTFPEIKPMMVFLLEMLNKRPNQNVNLQTIRTKLIQVIEARKQSTEKRHDLLQLLLDAEIPGTKVLDEDNLCPMNDNTSLFKPDNQTDEDKTDLETKEPNSSKKNTNSKPLTTEEVIAQANLFLFAGYETSSTALSYTIYLMATNPHIQKRLQQDIDCAFMKTESSEFGSLELYDAIVKLPYLNAVIYEVLRFYPFASTVVNRMCLKSEGTYLSNGLHIPEGTNVIPNTYAIHFDKDIWTTIDPYTFSPDRFLQTTEEDFEFIGPPHPFAWLPFGAGPRNCIGQRFAMMVIKATLARFFRHFQVQCSDETETPLKLRVGATISPKNGVKIIVNKRYL